MSQDFKTPVQRDGFAVIPACLDETTLESLGTEFDDSHYPERNLLSMQSIQTLATSSSVREIMRLSLDPNVSRFGGFSSIRREHRTGRSLGIKT
jgi:hypothetical protein